MPREDLERFRRLVLEDAALQQALQDTPDVPSFLALAQRLGAEQGCHFTAEELRSAMSDERRALRERWV